MQTLNFSKNPMRIFTIIDTIVKNADRNTELGYRTVDAVSSNVPYFQVIQTVKRSIENDYLKAVAAFGEDTVKLIIKF